MLSRVDPELSRTVSIHNIDEPCRSMSDSVDTMSISCRVANLSSPAPIHVNTKSCLSIRAESRRVVQQSVLTLFGNIPEGLELCYPSASRSYLCFGREDGQQGSAISDRAKHQVGSEVGIPEPLRNGSWAGCYNIFNTLVSVLLPSYFLFISSFGTST